ncbi:rod shape-determining protein MreC, partial [Patescibacteria group bacterium]|nr:rod shape-determining protein MreC [Patescibacteria group bacterium]
KFLFSLVIIFVIIIIVILQSLNYLQPLDRAVTFLLNPITRGFYSLGQKTSNWLAGQKSIDQLIDENQLLADQINNLLIENSRLSEQLKSYQEISDQLEFIREYKFESVTASVVGLNTAVDQKIYLLNKGSDHGVGEGYPVIIEDGVLVGKIIESNPQISSLQLITDSQSTISGEIQNEAGSLGVIEGELGLSMSMSLIPQEAAIEPGQLVITSGLDFSTPRGLLIGQINKLTTQTGELFQTVDLDTVTELTEINIVSIILPNND